MLVLAAGVGTVFKFQRDYTILTARVVALEKHESEVKDLLRNVRVCKKLNCY